MEATKVKVRERDLAVRRHRTWHRILFLPPHPTPPLSTPLPSSPPRLLVLAHVSAYRFHGPPRKRHHLTGRSNSGENRVLRGTGLHYVTACTSISISREIKIEKKENEKARISSTLSLFDRRADSRYLRIDNRRGTTVIHTSTGGYATQRVNDELLHLTTV